MHCIIEELIQAMRTEANPQNLASALYMVMPFNAFCRMLLSQEENEMILDQVVSLMSHPNKTIRKAAQTTLGSILYKMEDVEQKQMLDRFMKLAGSEEEKGVRLGGGWDHGVDSGRVRVRRGGQERIVPDLERSLAVFDSLHGEDQRGKRRDLGSDRRFTKEPRQAPGAAQEGVFSGRLGFDLDQLELYFVHSLSCLVLEQTLHRFFCFILITSPNEIATPCVLLRMR